MQTGARLRHLFAIILTTCEPAQPLNLWNQFKDSICDNLPFRLRTLGISHTSADVHDYGLFLLDGILHETGHSVAEFGLPSATQAWDGCTSNRLIMEAMAFDTGQEHTLGAAQRDSLNPEQREAFNRIFDSVRDHLGKHFFLHGLGGTGKTYLYSTLSHVLRGNAAIVLCVASSGIAALLLPHGRTAHSTFKIPVERLTEDSTCAVSKDSLLASLLRMTSLIIWDEATMLHRYAAEALDKTCQDVCDNDCPFGGITVVFGGDFQQTLPIIPKGAREDAAALLPVEGNGGPSLASQHAA